MTRAAAVVTLGFALAGLVASSAFAGDTPRLTISASDGDPWVTSSAPAGGPRTLYVWLHGETPTQLLHGLDIILAPDGALTVTSVRPRSPFESFGQVWGPLHASFALVPVDACLSGPIVVAEVDVQDAGGRLCLLEQSFATCLMACEESFYMSYEGFVSSGVPACSLSDHFGCGSYPAVEDGTWGRTKSAYRRNP